MAENFSPTHQKWHWFLLFIVFGFTFFVHNDAFFVDLMESRNIVTAREMVYDGNWLFPTMNGEIRLEKPPLPTWGAAVAELVSPDNIVVQRAMAGLAAVLLVCFFYLFACRLTQNRTYALVSTLVLCTSYNVVLLGRTATWDIYCHAFMMGAVYFLFKGWRACTCRYSSFVCAGIFMGLSFLSKGPVSFYALLLPFAVAYWLVYRSGFRGKWAALLLALVIALVIGAWWYVFIYVYHPESSLFVFHKESSSWLNYNVRPWYYYWRFFLETGIWAVFLLTALVYPYWKKRVENPKAYALVFCWTLLIVVFLSFLPEKKYRYLFPCLIPAALTVGYLFWYWIQQARRRTWEGGAKRLYLFNALLVATVSVLIPAAVYWFVFKEGEISLLHFILLSALFVALSVALFVAAGKLRPLFFVLAVTGLFMVVEAFLLPYVGSLVGNEGGTTLRATRQVEALKPLPFYYNAADGQIRMELVYDAYKKIRKMDLTDKKSVTGALPFVLVSRQKAEEAIPDSIRNGLDLQWVGLYDNNRWQKNNRRRYSPEFINHVTIVRRK